MAKLSAEEKALLARMLEAEDDDTEDDEPETPEEEADEFVYKGKRYVYTPEDVAEVQEEVAPKKAPRKKATAKPVEEEVEVVEETPAPVKRRFLT